MGDEIGCSSSIPVKIQHTRQYQFYLTEESIRNKSCRQIVEQAYGMQAQQFVFLRLKKQGQRCLCFSCVYGASLMKQGLKHMHIHCISDVNGSQGLGSLKVILMISKHIVLEHKPSAFPITPGNNKQHLVKEYQRVLILENNYLFQAFQITVLKKA